jgi:hypothetical protein
MVIPRQLRFNVCSGALDHRFCVQGRLDIPFVIVNLLQTICYSSSEQDFVVASYLVICTEHENTHFASIRHQCGSEAWLASSSNDATLESGLYEYTPLIRRKTSHSYMVRRGTSDNMGVGSGAISKHESASTFGFNWCRAGLARHDLSCPSVSPSDELQSESIHPLHHHHHYSGVRPSWTPSSTIFQQSLSSFLSYATLLPTIYHSPDTIP